MDACSSACLRANKRGVFSGCFAAAGAVGIAACETLIFLAQTRNGSLPFLPVRLVVFPEFAHAAPVFATVAELAEKLAVSIPNEHTERLAAKAREHDIYIQSGTMIEADPRWPGVLFNTTCLIGPTGILARYRKVNPWIPFEVHASPHDMAGYDEPLFPVRSR